MTVPAIFYETIDRNADKYIARLATAVAIPSVSGDAEYRKHVFEMAEYLKGELEKLNVSVRTVDLGKQVLDGQEIELPPAILGTLGNDPKKKTVLLYAHYDVQPVSSTVCTIKSRTCCLIHLLGSP
jgi:Cys-Gly metallodipeptidase DUG1